MSLTSDCENITEGIDSLFFEDPYEDSWILLKSSKNKDAILHRGYYYNH